MPFQFLAADEIIKNGISISLNRDPEPVGGYVSVEGSEGWSLIGKIPLQFPPRLSTDGKSGNWKTYDASTYEPIAIYSGAEARRISIEITYIVGAGSGWTGSKISSIERMIRSYFYRKMEDAAKNTPVVEIKQFYGVTGKPEKTTWRMKSVDVSFGEGIIIEGNFSYPLSRKITMELETYTQMAGRKGGGKAAADAAKGYSEASEDKDAPLPPNEPKEPEASAGESGQAPETKQPQENLNKIVDNFWY